MSKHFNNNWLLRLFSLATLSALLLEFRRQPRPDPLSLTIRAVANPGFSPAGVAVMELYRADKLFGEQSLLRGKNLLGANWRHVVMPKVDLEGADLRYADLRYALLEWANLTKVDFRRAKLMGTDFSRSTLTRARFMEANLRSAHLEAARASHASLFMAKAQRAKMRYITLDHADLQEADLHGADLNKANLSQSSLRDTNFAEANLEKANLEGALMENTNLTGANLSDAHFDNKTILPDAKYIVSADYKQSGYDKYWTPDTDMARYTDPYHPDFWQPKWVQKYAWVKRNYDED